MEAPPKSNGERDILGIGQPPGCATAAHLRFDPLGHGVRSWMVARPAVQRNAAAVGKVDAAGGQRLSGRADNGRGLPDTGSPHASALRTPATAAEACGHLTSADAQPQAARRYRGAGVAVAGPRRSCRSRPTAGHCGRWRGGCGTERRGRLGCPLLRPEPRSLSAGSVSGRLVSKGRCPDGWCPDGRCPPRTLPQPAGVRGYRNRSPARRPLDGCRHRRYARASWRPSRSPSWART